MSNRRTFLKSFGTTLAGIPLIPFSEDMLLEASDLIDTELLRQAANADSKEDFWSWVQQSYSSSPNFLNLNNGGVSPQPIVVQEAFKRYNDICNEAPSFFMWREFRKDVEAVKGKLAGLAGVSSDEIAINRNTTEALDTIINGLPLQSGDEVVVSPFDYPNMKSVWKMREKREGIKLKWVTFPAPCEDEELLIKAYTDQFSKNTKLVHLTHVVNWTGQVLPVAKIAAKARDMDIEVLVDGAHSFAQLDFTIPDLNCDYFGTSLHKWLCAPLGTGMTYVKKDKIQKLWPSFPNEEPNGDKITKFENLGTHSVPAEMAIGNAINFHLAIGTARKRDRLYYLKEYWASQVRDTPGVTLFTPKTKELSCALATFGVSGKTGVQVSNELHNRFSIHSTSVKIENVDAVRITPHVYTREYDLDRLVSAIKSIAKS